MEAFPITPDEMALRDDIMPTLSAGPAVTNTDAAHDQQGGTVYDNMFCEPMSMGEHVEEGGVFDDCKQFCLQDMDCAAATYYSVSEADDLFVSGNPWRGCYHFSSCDETSRKPSAFTSELFIKEETPSMSPPMSTTLRGVKESSEGGETFIAATAGAVGACVVVIAAVIHYRAKTVAHGSSMPSGEEEYKVNSNAMFRQGGSR
jgi:hypothetical protein